MKRFWSRLRFKLINLWRRLRGKPRLLSGASAQLYLVNADGTKTLLGNVASFNYEPVKSPPGPDAWVLTERVSQIGPLEPLSFTVTGWRVIENNLEKK